MDLDTFLQLEKRRLQEEKDRLSARSMPADFNERSCAAEQVLRNKNITVKCKRSVINQESYNNNNNSNNILLQRGIEEQQPDRISATSAYATINNNNNNNSAFSSRTSATGRTTTTTTPDRSDTFTLLLKGGGEYDVDEATPATPSGRRGGGAVPLTPGDVEYTKSAKEWANLKANKENAKENREEKTGGERRRKKDDMDQWVTDTFYSYFPGYNNENEKRQNYLRERQNEHQENLLKHQLLHPPISKANARKLRHRPTQQQQQQQEVDDANTTARSSSTTTTTTTTSHDKTDLEIIVNNPNYAPPKSSIRPSATRHKLLQDLRHTELSQIVGGDGVIERNRRNAEVESARKKDYQRELMAQIEEKRRSIEVLREKERRQDEALTRRLQEQLKTMHLEEQLEKEKMRADRLRFDTAQSRLMREHLLTKLEQDTQLLFSEKKRKAKSLDGHQDRAAAEAGTSHTAVDKNRVYQYFSNSAQHEYRARRSPNTVPPLELDLELPAPTHTERECFHLSEKVCPLCDAPLRSYESCCLRCQKKLSLKLKVSRKVKLNGVEAFDGNGKDPADTETVDEGEKEGKEEKVPEEVEVMEEEEQETSAESDCRRSFCLVCIKCERLYRMCSTCLAKSDVCRACHRKRNVCMNCRRTLCTFCLEEIACGRDTERSHVNEAHDNQQTNKNDERSFQVLEVNYAPYKESDLQAPGAASGDNADARPPYSMNIARNSIFHPDYVPTAVKATTSFEQLPRVADRHLNFDLGSRQTDEQKTMESVRKETEHRLSRYMENYGDLAQHRLRSKSESRNRSTQTISESRGRRDIVLHEEHNLSMPLLREMPKMTRKESGSLLEHAVTKQRKIDHLKQRWEIPAVQKFTISPTSPRVLTQVGAIRKQLQEERLLEDDY